MRTRRTRRNRPEVLRVRVLFAMLLAMSTSGCTGMQPRYAYVDSVASQSAEQMGRYVLLAEPRGYDDPRALPGYERKRHEKFVVLTHDVLRSAGFQKVESPDEAELVIVLDYGVEADTGAVHAQRTSSVKLIAFDWMAVRDADRRNALWRTHAWMDGSSGGLGRVVPELLEALRPYVGTRTDGAVEVILH
jgi:hypothetical protein